jgi:hypothetical protein
VCPISCPYLSGVARDFCSSNALTLEETMCVVCFDAPKQYAMLPCLHTCACEACAQQLLQVHHRCPVCREPIERFGWVFS